MVVGGRRCRLIARRSRSSHLCRIDALSLCRVLPVSWHFLPQSKKQLYWVFLGFRAALAEILILMMSWGVSQICSWEKLENDFFIFSPYWQNPTSLTKDRLELHHGKCSIQGVGSLSHVRMFQITLSQRLLLLDQSVSLSVTVTSA